MIAERILSLDMSTKTGWALMLSSDRGIELHANGQIPAIHEPPGNYPSNYIDWAFMVFAKISEVIDLYAPDVLVIEETVAGSKEVYSQKILEWIHFLVAKFIKETNIKVVYFLTGQWRSIVGSKMTKEESNHNKAVKEYKKKHGTRVAKDENGKRIGKLTKKHVNIRRANEVFGKYFKTPLRKKDEDTADALLLGYAYHIKRLENE